jgi:divinyl chlorophyllide a 8-vinyl-reductase
MAHPSPPRPMRVALLGSTGTIGNATARALAARGHVVVCLSRKPVSIPRGESRVVDVADPSSIASGGFRGEIFDAVISCMASRTGAPADAWAVDYQAHLNALSAAQAAGVTHFVLLSAICVQRPLLEFQRAKLAFEATLAQSGVRYSIVRPTAYFKSLAGQFARVRQGRPFLVFGDGALTACKPISDADLADYLVDCLADESRWNRISPIGGPGPALTPRAQGELLFAAVKMKPRFRSVPVGVLDAVIAGLDLAGRVAPALRAKAELARIGRYYATQSMLVFNGASGRYDADATPETGRDTLGGFYTSLAAGGAPPDRGDHAVF